jgi:tRNA-splicing endonuclease subunit Sen54
MADVDGNDLSPESKGIPVPGIDDNSDSDEESAEFRKILAALSKKQGSSLKRGEKDFEPNATRLQADTLDESRKVIHDELSKVRVQFGRETNVGQFVDDRSRNNAWDNALRAQLGDSQDWNDRCVVIYNLKGTLNKSYGRTDYRGWTWLLPEEALFLLERGSLDIRFPDIPRGDSSHFESGPSASDAGLSLQEIESTVSGDDSGVGDYDEPNQEEPIGQLPLSLQAAYALFAGRNGLNMDRYLVYTNLRRLGYILQRAPTWYDYTLDEEISSSSVGRPTTVPAPNPAAPQATPPLLQRLLAFLKNPYPPTTNRATGPLTGPGLYRGWPAYFQLLSLIPYHIPQKPTNPASPTGAYTIAFNAWKPSTSYKKSSPPPPDYRISVVDARATSVPALEQIGTLLDTMPNDEPAAHERAEKKIKHGKRSVFIAIVDVGVVSYLRFGEAGIGEYKIFEEKAARASKGARRGGGVGRGRGGRGRGGRGRGGGAGAPTG